MAKAAGFDFIECTVLSLEPEADERRFAEIMARYRQSALPVKAFNVFLPRDLKIVGPEVNAARVERYVQTALRRVDAVGARTVVFGSGGARHIDEGFDRALAEAQIADFLRLVGDVAAPYRIVVCIEPLNRRESNVINSVAEGAAMAQRVNHPAIRLLADFYHMEEEQENLADVQRYGAWLAHVHVVDTGRLPPGSGHYPYAEFRSYLEQGGYGSSPDQRVSVECRWQDFEAEAPAAVQFLHSVWQHDPER
jgi:sugar phosphate isomerase/epimerase